MGSWVTKQTDGQTEKVTFPKLQIPNSISLKADGWRGTTPTVRITVCQVYFRTMMVDDHVDDRHHRRMMMLQLLHQQQQYHQVSSCWRKRKKMNHVSLVASIDARIWERRRRPPSPSRSWSSSSRLHNPFLSIISLVLFCILLPNIPTTLGLSLFSSRIVSKKKSSTPSLTISTSPSKSKTSSTSGGINPNDINAKHLISVLQKCYTPHDVLQNVGQYVTPQVDPYGKLSSLILVRLSKQLITQSNSSQHEEQQGQHGEQRQKGHIPDWNGILPQIMATLSQANWIGEPEDEETLYSIVEGTKAAAVISRILLSTSTEDTSLFWNDTFGRFTSDWERHVASGCDDDVLMSKLQPHQLSGLKWSWDCFQLMNPTLSPFPPLLQDAYDQLQLPFRIRPGYFCGEHRRNDGENNDGDQLQTLTVTNLKEEVKFQVDEIKTESNRIVKERRQTAWQGDDHVGPFLYSGKSMERHTWSPIVLDIRDQLHEKSDGGGRGIYYDCCLLNLYPDGGSGMRYHIDPDQGALWGYETAVVSVGATRKFAFRDIPSTQQPQSTSPPPPPPIGERNDDPSTKKNTRKGRGTKKQQVQQTQVSKPHSFVVMHGDVTEMFDDCQSRFQHTVKQAETKTETSERISLVFKKTL